MSGSSAEPPTGARAFLEVGRIEKPHGVRGDVIVRLTTNRVERLAPGAVLHTPTGTLEVVASKSHHDRYLVTFAGVKGREGADELRGYSLWAPPLDDPDELWVHDLIGAEVVDYDELLCGKKRASSCGAVTFPVSLFVQVAGTSIPLALMSGRVPPTTCFLMNLQQEICVVTISLILHR